MKKILITGSILLFLSIGNLPIGYFTFLRIAITIISIIMVISEYKNEINGTVIFFGITTIIFNPIFPVYLGSKSAWVPIDLICGFIFLVFAIKPNKINKNV